MRDVLGKLKEGKSVEIPIYDFTLHQRVKETKRVYGATGNDLIKHTFIWICSKITF